MTHFLLYLLVGGKFAVTVHTAQFETRALCMDALAALEQKFPDEIRGGLCVQQEVKL